MGLFGREFGGCSTEGWNRIGRAGRASGKAVAIELNSPSHGRRVS